MPASAISSFARLLRRFRRNTDGATVVEFAIVAPTFIALLFAILETALIFFASQVLETVTQDSARMIKTGRAQTDQLDPSQVQALQTCNVPSDGSSALNQAQFKCLVCANIPGLFDCNNLSVDVQSYPTFSSINLNSQIDAQGHFIDNMQYNTGGPGSIVVVRVFYPWQMVVTGLGYNISNMADYKRLLVATAAFQTEPYLK